jgi:hypothetical protein
MLACYPHKIKRFSGFGTLSGSGTEARHVLQALMEHQVHQKSLSQQTRNRSPTVPGSSAPLIATQHNLRALGPGFESCESVAQLLSAQLSVVWRWPLSTLWFRVNRKTLCPGLAHLAAGFFLRGSHTELVWGVSMLGRE